MIDQTPHPERSWAAFNTVHASYWTLLMAKLFGEKLRYVESGFLVESYIYKGVLYLMKCEAVDER